MRGAIHKIHRWAGLTLCIPLVALGLTGSILVFQHELADAHYALATGNPHNVGEILDAARAAAPEGFSPSMFRPAAPDSPASVFLSQKSRKPGGSGGQGKRMQMLIDPASLAVLNKDASNSWMNTIKQLHGSLLLRDYGGRSIVGWFGVAMLLFGISGLVLWWPRHERSGWQAFTVKRGARGFRLYRDLHGAAGIWGFAVFITVSFSGVYLAFPETMGAVIGSVFTARDLRTMPKIEPIEGETPMAVDDAVALAQHAIPGSKWASVMLPAKPDQPYRIAFARPETKDGAPVINVFVDPWAKKIIETRDPQDYSTGETIIAWQHALHSGQGFGWPWRILLFTMGFMPLLFSCTGISMWLAKRRPRGIRAEHYKAAVQ